MDAVTNKRGLESSQLTLFDVDGGLDAWVDGVGVVGANRETRGVIKYQALINLNALQLPTHT